MATIRLNWLEKANARFDKIEPIAIASDWSVERWSDWWGREFDAQRRDRSRDRIELGYIPSPLRDLS